MSNLPEKDRRILRAVFLEEMDKAKICEHFGIDPNYLRVLLHRAKKHFRAICEERGYEPLINRGKV